jgi:hypothetical protein
MALRPADEVEAGFFKGMIYGGPGVGKTFTALKIATAYGKTALMDTERGAEAYKKDFRCPDGSSFLIENVASIVRADEIVDEAIDEGCEWLIVDQITYFWEHVQEVWLDNERQKDSRAYKNTVEHGKIPWYCWGDIKRPYKKFIRKLLNAQINVIMCSRASDVYIVDNENKPKKVGSRPDAEKSTPYEPQTVLRMEFSETKKKWMALGEKDRWNVLKGELFYNPGPEIIEPILKKMGRVHAPLPEVEDPIAEAAAVDTKEKVVEVDATVMVNGGQLKIIKTLLKKGGIAYADVEERIQNMTCQEASVLINNMTAGKYDGIKPKEIE